MNLTTQISGGYGEDGRRVFALKRKLQNLNISVTHPIGDGSIIIEQNQIHDGTTDWLPYEIFLDYYDSIADSDFHVVYNESGAIDENIGMEIVYAMSKRKPIILLHPPIFAPGVHKPVIKIIEEHLNKLIVCDITILDGHDIAILLQDVAQRPVTYSLSNKEGLIIKRLVKDYFRMLLGAHDGVRQLATTN